jgi:hypothetical protein
VACRPLLGGNREIGDCRAAFAGQRLANSNRRMAFSARSVRKKLTATGEMCFLCGPCRNVISRTIGGMS